MGCGGGPTRAHPLDRDWDDRSGAELSAWLERWAPGPWQTRPSIVVALPTPQSLVGKVLGADTTWRLEHELDSRPIVAGSLVVGLGGGELFVLDGRSGEQVWSRPAEGKLRGAADDGSTTLVSIESLGASHSVVLAVDRDGVVLRQLDVAARIGAPALRGNVAFLPWDDSMVVVFDFALGREAARVVSTTPVSRAWTADGEVFFGSELALHLDETIVAARRSASPMLRLPTRSLPGDPVWIESGTEPAPPVATRSDSVRIYARARAARDGASRRFVGVHGDGYVLGYDRVAVGLDAATGTSRWVHLSPSPFIGGAAAVDGTCLCDRTGRVRCLEHRTGAVLRDETLGVAPLGCVVQVDRIGVVGATPARPPRPIEEQLGALLALGEPLLLPLQVELLGDLAARDGELASRMLVDLARRELVAPELRTELARVLAERRSGPQALLEALADEASRPVLAGPFVLPVGAVAQALAAMDVREAAPSLARLLRRATADDHGLALVLALERLGGQPELSPLRRLAARWACEARPGGSAVLLRTTCRALLRLRDRAFVAKLRNQPCLDPTIALELDRLLLGSAPERMP